MHLASYDTRMKAKPFLTATWSNVLLFTYPIAPEPLVLRIPEGLELDTIDGQAYVSLVAFDFTDTRVKGVRWPGFVNFPEINLRFYLRDPISGRRGVRFIREFVPSALIARLARMLYNEPYKSTPIQSTVHDNGQMVMVQHDWEWNDESHRVRVTSENKPFVPPEGTASHHFKEHRWGFGRSKKGDATIYEVQHPRWEILPVRNYEVDVDFGSLYGAEFGSLNEIEPVSVIHAVGSKIEVFPDHPLVGELGVEEPANFRGDE